MKNLRYEDMKDGDFTPDEEVTVVENLDEIPHFATEEEAAQWWDTNSLADSLWSKSRRGPPLRLVERAQAEREQRKLAEKSAGASAVQDATAFVDTIALKAEPGSVDTIVTLGIIAAVGLLAAGIVIYEVFKAKHVPSSFEPTSIPYLSILRLGDAALKAVETTARTKAAL